MTEPVWTGPADDARRRPGPQAPTQGVAAWPVGAPQHPGSYTDGVPGPRESDPYAAAGPYRDADPYRDASPYAAASPYPKPEPGPAADPYAAASPYPNPQPNSNSNPNPNPGAAAADPYAAASPYPYPNPDPNSRYPAAGPGIVPPEPSYSPEAADEQPWLGASMPPTRRRRGSRGGPPSAAGRADGAGPPDTDPGAGSRASRRSLRPKNRPQTPLQAAVGAVTEVVVVLGMALALSLLIKTFLVQAFFIPSQSMEDTLLVGDRVLVSKLTPGPFDLHRGDVIVFKDPGGWLEATPAPAEGPLRGGLRTALTFVGLLPQDSGEHLIKRVIGLPGDTVTCCDAKGRLMVNGKPIDETYLRAGNVPSTEKFTVTVQQSHLWVMGDNRSESADSRYHRALNDGQVPVSDVVGKAFVVVWPFSRFGGVLEPPSVFSAVPAAASR